MLIGPPMAVEGPSVTARRDAQLRDQEMRFKYRPKTFAEIWNPEDPGTRRLIESIRTERLRGCNAFVGEFSSGKTARATIAGQWSSCAVCETEALPCGDCPGCVAVQRSWGGEVLGFVDVDATQDNVEEAILTAYRRTAWGNKFSFYDPIIKNPRPFVVLIDEAHRLPPKPQERLLKRIEKWPDTVIILATTRTDKLDAGLLSRSTIYEFAMPTPEEAAPHLQRIAACESAQLEPDAALKLARHCGGVPRTCLGALHELLGVGDRIGIAEVDEFIALTNPARELIHVDDDDL